MAKRYNIDFTNEVNQAINVVLTPKGTIDATESLKAVDNTFKIRADVADDDKLTFQIISRQLDFAYMYDPENPVPIETFVSDEVDAWTVEVFIDGGANSFFKGFLSIYGNNQPLLNRRTHIFLTATDGLSQLKSLDFSEDHPEKESMLYFISQMIGETALPGVNLRTVWNITNPTMTGRNVDPTYDPLNEIYIERKLFDGLSIYDAINKFLKNTKCRLFQENGYYWLDSLGDRLIAKGVSYSEYEIEKVGSVYEFTQVGSAFNVDYSCLIAGGNLVRPINRDATKYLLIPKKSTQLTHNFKVPSELFCNQTPKDGSSLGPLGFTPLGYRSTDSIERFTLDCWEFYDGDILDEVTVPFVNGTYFVAQNEFAQELERWISVRSLTANRHRYKLHSQRFNITQGDRFNFSLTFRNESPSNSYLTDWDFTLNIAAFVVYGDNGNVYFLRNDGSWSSAESYLTARYKGDVTTGLGTTQVSGQFDYEWRELSWEVSDNIPVTGQAMVVLINSTAFANEESWFKDIKIDIFFTADSSARKKVGSLTKVTDNLRTLERYEDEIEMDDFVNANVLGALYKPPTIDPELREPYNRQWAFYGDFVASRPYTKLMAEIIQSHQRKVLYKVESSLKGLIFTVGTNTYPIGFLPRYRWTELNPNIEFMLTGAFEIDLNKGHWRGVFVQTMENYQVDEFSDSTNYEFKYLTS